MHYICPFVQIVTGTHTQNEMSSKCPLAPYTMCLRIEIFVDIVQKLIQDSKREIKNIPLSKHLHMRYIKIVRILELDTKNTDSELYYQIKDINIQIENV